MSLTAFHPTIGRWFRSELGAPTPAQERAWPQIRAGRHVLVAAPTGSGKTLAGFLWALDSCLQEASALPDQTRVLYVSPLKALGNDVRKNLLGPLARLRELDPSLPEVRVLVRSGDTPPSQRTAMARRPPHVLVTTPQSLYLMLTSEGGRALLATVRTVIVDEIHAILGDKRAAHLALSLERLEALVQAQGPDPEGTGGKNAGGLQRIGLSATQRPLVEVGRFLAGVGREAQLVDEGHLRPLDLAVEIPPSPLSAVCSHETWAEIYRRVAELVGGHKTTLVFVSTRKMAERAAARLAELIGEEAVACHHSSLSKERRLDAEQRLAAGELRALVATASLELGIDVGDVELVCQLGTTRSIATLLQRVGRSGHGVGRLPKGRLFPLTQDELVEAAALLLAYRRGELDRTPQPTAPLDILAQQIVAACAAQTWSEDELYERLRRAWPYRNLTRADFDAAVALHSRGRAALLHRDGVGRRLRGTRRSRLVALTCGGAIPDTSQYRVLLEPDGTFLGTLDEDFAVESSAGDVFQLGNASWQVLRIESGVVRVADAKGSPPTLPFWFGEAPARTAELSERVGEVRERAGAPGWAERECGLDQAAAEELRRYLAEGAQALGCVPTGERLVLERFFDESGGSQLVLHAPLGGRVNRAFGLALRKRFCRRFGFELQAAANEDAIVLSLGPQHSFPLEEVFDYLRPDTVRELLVQAVLPTPLFQTRWRWNVARALVVERSRKGQRVPAPLLRMRADDELARAFPGAVACGETLPPGDIEIPRDHPLVRQTLEDCLHQALDVDLLEEVLRRLRDGRIARVALDLPEPSAFARSVLAVRPYGFLDDAPLEERRTQAVLSRRALSSRDAEAIGALDDDAVARVREEAWPDPRDGEELHEALTWMGYLAGDEAGPWRAWLAELEQAGRVVHDGSRWFAAEATRDPKEVLRGRLQALGPIHSDDPLLLELEREGAVLRIQLEGRRHWCDRRLLARIQRYTLERLRREIEPVATADYLRFLAAWHGCTGEERPEGPAGCLQAVRRLAGWEAPAAAWERRLLAARVRGYRQRWLDELAFSGRVVWGRLFGAGRSALRATPITLLAREDLDGWLSLAAAVEREGELSWQGRAVTEELARRGALFAEDLARALAMLPSDVERGLQEGISHGLVTSDSFASLRQLLRAPHRRRSPIAAAGRWSLLRPAASELPPPDPSFAARRLLDRYGVLFRAVLERERLPLPWRELARACRALELAGEIRGGRFVAGFSGEQFALPEAVPLLRRVRRDPPPEHPEIAPADPLNLTGILTPGARIPSHRAPATRPACRAFQRGTIALA